MDRKRWISFCLVLTGATHVLCKNITCWELPCRQNIYTFDCCIGQLEIDDGTTIESANFARQQYILLEDSNIYTASPQLFQLMTDAKMLEISGGFVPWVHLRSSITMLTICHSQTQQIFIDPDQAKYRLMWLEVRNVSMTQMPENLNLLRDLEHIGLIDSELEFIVLDQFDGLNKLEELNLSGNKLSKIHVNFPTRLPALRTFHLNNNRLTGIDLSFWHMPELTTFDLSSNQLKYMAHYNDNQFDKLCAIKADHNRWNCKWLEEFLFACFHFRGYVYGVRQEECDEGEQWRENCCYGNETADSYQEYLGVMQPV